MNRRIRKKKKTKITEAINGLVSIAERAGTATAGCYTGSF